jgi:hypothetical protein
VLERVKGQGRRIIGERGFGHLHSTQLETRTKGVCVKLKAPSGYPHYPIVSFICRVNGWGFFNRTDGCGLFTGSANVWQQSHGGAEDGASSTRIRCFCRLLILAWHGTSLTRATMSHREGGYLSNGQLQRQACNIHAKCILSKGVSQI